MNVAGPSPLGGNLEAQIISILLNQRALETDFVFRRTQQQLESGISGEIGFNISNIEYASYSDDITIRSSSSVANTSIVDSQRFNSFNQSSKKKLLPFQYGRLLFNQMGLAGWERRKRTNLLNRTDKLMRELRNLDAQKCRETHKMAVIYVGSGQEDKHSILR